MNIVEDKSNNNHNVVEKDRRFKTNVTENDIVNYWAEEKFKKTIVDYSKLIHSLTLIAARYLQLLALVEWYAIEANSLVSLCTLHQGQDNLEDLRYANRDYPNYCLVASRSMPCLVSFLG